MSRHGRLPWFEPGALTAEQQRLYDAIATGPRGRGVQAFPLTDGEGRLEGPFNALLVSPQVGTAVQELGAAIRYRTQLSGRAREIAILELAATRRSEFEWYAHERIGRNAGLTDDELEALRTGREAPTLSAQEALVRRTVARLARERDLDDEAFHEAEAGLGAGVLMEVVWLAGYYDAIALSLRVWRTPLPEGIAPVFG